MLLSENNIAHTAQTVYVLCRIYIYY